MKTAPTRSPICERCSHPREDVEGFIAIHKGGMAMYICFSCIDDMKVIADRYRAIVAEGYSTPRDPTPAPRLRAGLPLSPSYDPHAEDDR
jgi:hypothetical protein